MTKHDRTRINLRIIPQVPFGIEFHRIGISSWVVSHLPIQSSQSTDQTRTYKKTSTSSLLTRRSQSPWNPWESGTPHIHRPRLQCVGLLAGSKRSASPRGKREHRLANSEKVKLTQRSHRTPPEHLLHHRLNVGEVRLIGQRGESIIPNDPIDFLLSLPLNLRMQQHRQEKRMNHGYRLDNKTPFQ